ncbi:MAG: dihydropyrimidinase [Bacteroidetes bacterium]|nr:dihydropyrimidinase [Bacteroidota bacterium]
MKILIKNCHIITADKSYFSDILICDGTIQQIAKNIELSDKNVKIINAENKYVFPGGIDPHVHMHLPTPAGYSSDDFDSGSKAAIAGGTTTIIDFVTPKKGQSLIEALELRQKEAEKSHIKCYFHVSPIEWTENTENEIIECVNQGIKSFKVYMAYKKSIGLNDDILEKVIKIVAKAGGILTVHAEIGDLIEELRDDFFNKGNTSPLYHAKSRPDYTESEAVKKVISLTKKHSCPLYIVHLSAAASIEHIKKALQDNQQVFAEACPHHLLLNETKYVGSFEDTSKFVLSPPLRTKNDNEALWKAISEGIIKTVGTDHCPFSSIQKSIGKDDFRKIPNGAGGVEHRMSLLFTYGVLENRISLNKFVELTSTNAAKIFGLYPKKGEIAVNSDADIVIWDPKLESIISSKSHKQNCDTNIYEGFKTIGGPEVVILSGKIL